MRPLRRAATALALACAAGPAIAQPAAPAFEQRLGASLPMQLAFIDANGRGLTLAELLREGRPIVLVPAYYRCDTLCGTVMHGAIEALADSGLPPDRWRLVAFSFDAQDTPADAAPLQRVYRDYAHWSRPAVFSEARGLDLRLLSGRAGAELARHIGFDARSEAEAAQYAHPTGLVVLTPEGRVSRYFFGVRFDPRALRLALVDASGERIGSLADRLLVACSHLRSLAGRHDGAVMALLRAVGIALAAGLAIWIWRHRAVPAEP
jgi:protein SCO1/2